MSRKHQSAMKEAKKRAAPIRQRMPEAENERLSAALLEVGNEAIAQARRIRTLESVNDGLWKRLHRIAQLAAPLCHPQLVKP